MPTIKKLLSIGLFGLIVLVSTNPNPALAQGNHPPAPGFTITPGVGDTTTLFNFDASSSTDVEDGTGPNSFLQVRYDFEGDGTFDTAFSVNKTATHTYPVAANYNPTIEVRDTAGNVANLSKPLIVNAAPPPPPPPVGNPPAPGFSIIPGTGDTNTNFTFDGSSSTDVEDGTGPNSPLQVRYDFEGDGNFDTAFSVNKIAGHVYPAPATYNVRMEVRDTAGNVANLVKPLTVTAVVNPPVGGGLLRRRKSKRRANKAPVASLTASKITVNTNEKLMLDASNTTDDRQHHWLLFKFDFDGDNTFDTIYTHKRMAEVSYSEPGQKTAVVIVRDSGGAEARATVTIEVVQPAKIKQPDIKPRAKRLNKFYRKHLQYDERLPEPTTSKQLQLSSSVSKEIVEGTQMIKRTITIKNNSFFSIRNIKLVDSKTTPTNGGRLMVNVPNFGGSNFFPKAGYGNMHSGYLTINEIPAGGILHINYTLVPSTLTIPFGEESRIAFLTLLVNTGERTIDTIVIRSRVPVRSPLRQAGDLAPLALIAGGMISSRRKLLDSIED